uniref:Protein kinase n=1 Tax=Kalmanozyma brasiliensis (strain GHG001) TaxID=1365824 RepID=V5EWK3_KALBG
MAASGSRRASTTGIGEESEAKRPKLSASAHDGSRTGSLNDESNTSPSGGHILSERHGTDAPDGPAKASPRAGSAAQPPNAHHGAADPPPLEASRTSASQSSASTTPAVEAGPSTSAAAPAPIAAPAAPPRAPDPFIPAPAWSALSRSAHPTLTPSRSIYTYERLNHIQEGTYGVVFRARPRDTTPPPAVSRLRRIGYPGVTAGEVAVKKLKLDNAGGSGFPITALREIQTLTLTRSLPSVVRLEEVCVGKTLDQIFLILQFMEHDLKSLISLMHRRGVGWKGSEVKCLLHQLLTGVKGLHAAWVVHRDLKSSNILMDNRGRLSIGDFGLARRFGDPIDGWRDVQHPRTHLATPTNEGNGGMTDLVVTLWYRAPELLLLHQTLERPRSADSPPRSMPLYDEKIDIWSVGCIFAELLLTHQSGGGLFQGKNEADQLRKIERVLGAPNATIWPELPLWRGASQVAPTPSPTAVADEERRVKQGALDLLFRLLHWDPKQRPSAEAALQHAYFKEAPKMAHPDSFGSFPSAAKGESVEVDTPSAPNVHAQRARDGDRADKGNAGKAYQMEFDFTA